MPPVQARAQVLGVRRVGAYYQLSFVAPGIAEVARPGQFVALATGGPDTALVTRRAFAIHHASPHGVYGGSIEIVFAVHGLGTGWLAKLSQHDPLDVVGPLGRPFSMPKQRAVCMLVGGGYGSAPLLSLGAALRSRGCRVDFVLGAADDSRLFGALDARRMAASLTLTTEDGSTGTRGVVSDVLPEMLDRTGAEVVYASGPMGMLRAVAEISAERGLPSQCSVEQEMACGIGICMTCVLPVVGDDGVTRMLRSCVEGPVFRGDSVRWAEIGGVPADTWGAAAAAAPSRNGAANATVPAETEDGGHVGDAVGADRAPEDVAISGERS